MACFERQTTVEASENLLKVGVKDRKTVEYRHIDDEKDRRNNPALLVTDR